MRKNVPPAVAFDLAKMYCTHLLDMLGDGDGMDKGRESKMERVW